MDAAHGGGIKRFNSLIKVKEISFILKLVLMEHELDHDQSLALEKPGYHAQ